MKRFPILYDCYVKYIIFNNDCILKSLQILWLGESSKGVYGRRRYLSVEVGVGVCTLVMIMIRIQIQHCANNIDKRIYQYRITLFQWWWQRMEGIWWCWDEKDNMRSWTRKRHACMYALFFWFLGLLLEHFHNIIPHIGQAAFVG